eukprot:jgi/Botrbrau1/18555/Bobra.0367s0006.1
MMQSNAFWISRSSTCPNRTSVQALWIETGRQLPYLARREHLNHCSNNIALQVHKQQSVQSRFVCRARLVAPLFVQSPKESLLLTSSITMVPATIPETLSTGMRFPRSPTQHSFSAGKAAVGTQPKLGDSDTVPQQSKSLAPMVPQRDPSRASSVPREEALPGGVPVYVMLPLDTVDAKGEFHGRPWLDEALRSLSEAGVRGIATDVWWGAVEQGVEQYKWSGYRKLFDKVRQYNLKVQVVMSFHSCGSNVGDDVNINLPKFVDEAIGQTAGYFYRGVTRERFNPNLPENKEYISLFVDLLECLPGKNGQSRTPIQCYGDFMRSFRDEFKGDLGSLIEEVVVGTGPCGELRYPSYVEEHGWRFPGVGEFQSQGCFAKQSFAAFMENRARGLEGEAERSSMPDPQRLALLDDAARIRAYLTHSEQPEDAAGNYNSRPDETQFFNGITGSWKTELGQLFLEWYQGALLGHGDRLLEVATAIFRSKQKPNKDIPGPPSVPIPRPPPSADAKSGGPASKQAFKPFTAVLDRLKMPFRPSDAQPTAPSEDELEVEREKQPVGPPAFRWAIGRLNSFSVPKPLEEDKPDGAEVEVTLKIAGVHWYYAHASHAAELTAGYHNTERNNGYRPIVDMCARRGVALTLTCVEMRDQDHPPDAFCSPKRLIRLVRETCAELGVALAGENALPLFTPGQVNIPALYRIVENTDAWMSPLQENFRKGREADPGVGQISSVAPDNLGDIPNRSGDKPREAHLPSMRSFTFLRLTDQIVQEPFASEWRHFIHRMRRNGEGRPDPEADPYGPPNYGAGMK